MKFLIVLLMLADCGSWPCPDPPAQATSDTGYVFKRGKCWETSEERCCDYASVDREPSCTLQGCAPLDDCRSMVSLGGCEPVQPADAEPIELDVTP